MTLVNGWRVSKANPDTERAHLNKILAEIQAAVGGGISFGDAFETVSKNLASNDAVFNYSMGRLSNIVYAGGLITKTFNFTGDKLTSIVLSGSTPSGINLTKTLAYSGDQLTSITYS